MNSVLSHEVREAIVSLIHQVFPTANVKFTFPFRGEGIKPISEKGNSLHTSLCPPGLRFSAFHHDQKNGGKEKNEGEGGDGDAPAAAAAAPAFQSVSSSSSFSSFAAPSLSRHLSHVSPPVLPFITDACFAPSLPPPSCTSTSFSVHQQGGGEKGKAGESGPSSHPFSLPSSSLCTALPWPRLVSHLYALLGWCSSSHFASPSFTGRTSFGTPSCDHPSCLLFPLFNSFLSLPTPTSSNKNSTGSSNSNSGQCGVLEGGGESRRGSGDVLPLLPFFPHVVVRVSGYEQVDLNRVIIPCLRKVIPAVREEETSSALRDYNPVESGSGIPSPGLASSAPRDPPCREKNNNNTKADFSIKPLPVTHPLDAGGTGAKGVREKSVTPPPSSSLPSSLSSFVSVWSCRRPPKYARLHAELCDSLPVFPSSSHPHCRPSPPPPPQDSFCPHLSFSTSTGVQDTRMYRDRVGNKRWETGKERSENRPGSRLDSFIHRETWNEQNLESLVERKKNCDKVSPLAHHYDRRTSRVGGAEEHGGNCAPKRHTSSLYCSRKDKTRASFSSFLEGKMETSDLFSSIHSTRSWWDWMTRRWLPSSPNLPFCAAENSHSGSTALKKGKEGIPSLPPTTTTTLTCVETKTTNFSSPGSAHFSPPPGAPATSSSSSTRPFSSHGRMKSGVMYMSGDLLAMALPSSFVCSKQRKRDEALPPSLEKKKKKERKHTHEKSPTRLPRRVSRNIAAFQSLTQRGRGELLSNVFPHHTRCPKKMNSAGSGSEDHQAGSRLCHGNAMTSTTPNRSTNSGSRIAKSVGEEASLALSSHGIRTHQLYRTRCDNEEEKDIDKWYYPLFFSFGNTETNISQLLQTTCSCQREALRGAFGVSLPLLLASLPSICLDAVLRIQYWESTRASPLVNPPAPASSIITTTTSPSPTSSTMFLLSSLFHFISTLEDGELPSSPAHSTCSVSSSTRISDLVKEIMSVVGKCRRELGEEDLLQGPPSRQSEDVFLYNSDNHSSPPPPPLPYHHHHHHHTLYESRSALHISLLAAGEWLEARTRPDHAKDGGTSPHPPTPPIPIVHKMEDQPVYGARSPPISSIYHPPPPPSCSLSCLYAAVTTILAVGTVRMLLEITPSFLSASQEESPSPTVNHWTVEGISSTQCRKRTPTPLSSALHPRPTTDYVFVESFPPSPSLPFPRWKYNFFLPCEDFAAAQETRLWAERRGRVNVVNHNNNMNDGQDEDAREKNISITQGYSSPSSTDSQKRRNQERKEIEEWVSCVECLLESLV